jgi:hypothetical protein
MPQKASEEGSVCASNQSGQHHQLPALYGGTAPGFVAGVTQFNVQLGTPAAALATSEYSLSVGITSNIVNQGVWIKP